MARYYFNLHECGTVLEDEEGLDKPDMESVYREALRAAREIMCAEVIKGTVCLGCRIEVKDEAGEAVYSLAFKDAVAFTGI